MTPSPPVPDPWPPGTTFETLIARNRRRSRLLVVVLALVGALVFAAAGDIAAGGGLPAGPLLALVLLGLCASGIAAAASLRFGSSVLLRFAGARQIERDDDPELWNVVEEMAIAAGTPMPTVHLIESPSLNAFATGRDPAHASIAVTSALRQELNRDELQGVVAHEMSHVRHLDIRLMQLVATMAGFIVLAADAARFTTRGNRASRETSGTARTDGAQGGGSGTAIVVMIGLVLMIVAPLIARMLQLAISREREYLADAGAVALTRNPLGLASALRRLGSSTEPLASASRGNAHLWIVNPVLHARGRDDWDSVFSTHPPLAERIARLDALAGGGRPQPRGGGQA